MGVSDCSFNGGEKIRILELLSYKGKYEDSSDAKLCARLVLHFFCFQVKSQEVQSLHHTHNLQFNLIHKCSNWSPIYCSWACFQIRKCKMAVAGSDKTDNNNALIFSPMHKANVPHAIFMEFLHEKRKCLYFCVYLLLEIMWLLFLGKNALNWTTHVIK